MSIFVVICRYWSTYLDMGRYGSILSIYVDIGLSVEIGWLPWHGDLFRDLTYENIHYFGWLSHIVESRMTLLFFLYLPIFMVWQFFFTIFYHWQIFHGRKNGSQAFENKTLQNVGLIRQYNNDNFVMIFKSLIDDSMPLIAR